VPADFAIPRLLGEFQHVVEVEENDFISFVVGPSNPDFVPLADVSPHVTNSLMTTEDSGFLRHRGFIVREFRSALIDNLQAGRFKRGASSITMQLVKNAFLHRQKTLSRKLQELFLTWYLETVLSKERLLEMYVNVIEFGPGLYGIGPAARHYFGKAARDINPVEAAFFSSILPNPKQRYMQYCEGELHRRWDDKVQRILKLMHERGRLTDDEYALAVQTPLVFDRTEALPEAECKQKVHRMIQNTRPTSARKGG
jgi:membrane peptidoglycan carboxypeptidase